MSKFLIVLGGPTASGKTDVAISLAKHFGSEIISADSRQIYRELSIGTAVPTADQLATIKHHFIQTVSLETYYNASIYESEVIALLENLFLKNDIAIMVGGSGLYINAACLGIDDLPTVDPDIRRMLALKFREEGIESLRKELIKLDPDTYAKVDLNNHLRILKALEITIQTGKPYSSFLTHSHKPRNFKIIRLALNIERDQLYNRINKRVDSMIEQGLVQEVETMMHLRSTNVMKTVGYKEIINYFDTTISLDEAVDLIKRNTRKYARKQITWFRKDNLYEWFNPDNLDNIKEFCESRISD